MLEYFIEFRRRLLKCLVCVAFVFVGLFYFGQHLFSILAKPLLATLAPGQSMVAIGIASPFITPMKLSFYTSICLAMPYCLYHFWAFVAPALYPHERRMIGGLVFPSALLFYLGIAFAYWIVFPMVFGFLNQVLPEGVSFLPDIDHYLDFACQLFIAFGLCFQMPLVTIVLVLSGFLSLERLIELRPYVIVLAFIVGMLLTPPDVLSQILFALPMWFLYEVGLWVLKLKLRWSVQVSH